jgi:polysaccharide export outer membrane protein
MERRENHLLQPPAAKLDSTISRTGQLYRIQASDQVRVHFPLGKELDFDALVRSDGFITSPMYGDIPAEGRTPTELGRELEDVYAADVRNPRVVVSMMIMQQQWVYVFGEVARPDRYSLDSQLSLMSLLSRAGGVQSSAKLENIVILHVSSDSTYTYDLINLSSLFEQNNATPVYLAANDVIIVPRSLISDIRIFIDQYINTFLPPIDAFVRSRYYWKLASGELNN